jgi:hypothetical protein
MQIYLPSGQEQGKETEDHAKDQNDGRGSYLVVHHLHLRLYHRLILSMILRHLGGFFNHIQYS